MSHALYLAACREQITSLCHIVLDSAWACTSPETKRHIFVDITVGHEPSIGVNRYYFPNDNELIYQSPGEEPTSRPVTADILILFHRVTQIAYAMIKTAGIRTRGDLMRRDIEEAVRHMSRTCAAPPLRRAYRAIAFSHCVGNAHGELLNCYIDAAMNAYSCPSWSFCDRADDPMKDAALRRNLANSDAPYCMHL